MSSTQNQSSISMLPSLTPSVSSSLSPSNPASLSLSLSNSPSEFIQSSQTNSPSINSSNEVSIGEKQNSETTTIPTQPLQNSIREPSNIEPQISVPSNTEPQISEPQVSVPSNTETQMSDPQVSEPQVSDPQVSDPQVSDPSITESSISDSQVSDPSITESSISDPQITEPSMTPSLSEQSIEETQPITPADIEHSYNNSFYDQEIKEQPQQLSEEEEETQDKDIQNIDEPTPEVQTEITQEEYQQLEEKEKSIRSKILNQPPPCQKKQISPTDPYVEKVQLKTPLLENEQAISNILKTQIPQAFLYFQPLIETHPLEIGTITECKNMTDTQLTTTNQEELIEAKYKSAGNKTLEEFLQDQIKTPKQSNKFIQLLVNAHLQLLDEIQLLQSTTPPIVHFHITPQTVLYDETNGTPVLTDFRLAFTKTTIESPEESPDLFPIYENNPSWPIEVFLLSQLNENSNKSIEELATSFNNPTKQSPSSIETIKYKTPLELKQTFLSWDTYSVNQLIYSFLTTANIPLNIPFMRTYIELITKELTAEPSERSQIPQLQSKIRDIFKSVPKKEYMDFLQDLIQ